MTIPYVKDLSETLRRSFSKFDIQTSFKPCQTLRQRLVHVKDKPTKEKVRNVVYGIRCDQEECKEHYIGETQQTVRARMSQHRRSSGLSTIPNSAVYTHITESKHTFSNENVVILDREQNWIRRGIKEAIHERIENPSLNKKGGLRFNLSHTWDRTIKKIARPRLT